MESDGPAQPEDGREETDASGDTSTKLSGAGTVGLAIGVYYLR